MSSSRHLCGGAVSDRSESVNRGGVIAGPLGEGVLAVRTKLGDPYRGWVCPLQSIQYIYELITHFLCALRG